VPFFKAVFNANMLNVTLGLIAAAGLLLTLFLDSNADRTWKVVWFVLIVLFYLVIVFAIAAYRFSRNYGARIAVIKQAPSEGLTPGGSVVVAENPGYLSENVLLTLLSPKSGASQPLAILQIIKCVQGEHIQAVPFPIGAAMDDLKHYFEGDKTTLFVRPLVSVADLDRIGMKLVELQRQSLAPQRGSATHEAVQSREG
jgi:hypothetical protein